MPAKDTMLLTDRDLLVKCMHAFEVIPIAYDARKMLKELNVTPGAYAGNGSHILARTMAQMIQDYLALPAPIA